MWHALIALMPSESERNPRSARFSLMLCIRTGGSSPTRSKRRKILVHSPAGALYMVSGAISGVPANFPGYQFIDAEIRTPKFESPKTRTAFLSLSEREQDYFIKEESYFVKDFSSKIWSQSAALSTRFSAHICGNNLF